MIIITFLVLSGQSFAADRTVTSFELTVSGETTLISLNIPADFNFQNNTIKRQIEIVFDDCSVNILGERSIMIPAFSTFFDYVVLEELPQTGKTQLTAHLAEGEEIPRISIKPSLDSVSFEFSKFKSSESLVADVDSIDEKKVQSGRKKWNFRINPIPDPIVKIPETLDKDTIDLIPPDDESDLEIINVTEDISESIEEEEVKSGGEVQIVTRQDKDDKNEVTPELVEKEEFLPGAELEAVHYSEGRIDRDVLTIEFKGISPEFDYRKLDSGDFEINLLNVEVPVEILEGGSIKKQINGTFIESITLEKLLDRDEPVLCIRLECRESVEFTVDDLSGFLEIIIQKEL